MVDFLIVGTPKAGTTSLQAYLSEHPEIYMPKAKEIHFFGSEFNNVNRQSVDDYHAYFKLANQGVLKGEASVFYLYSEDAFNEIYKYNPNMKIIVCLRHPVDFLISYHQDSIYVGNEDELDLWKALDLEELRRKGECIPATNSFRKSILYSEMVNYSKHLKRFLDRFGREQMHVVLFNEFLNNPNQQYRNVLSFLRLSNLDFKPSLFDNKNPRRSLRNKNLNQQLKSPSRFLRLLIRVVLPFQSWRLSVSNYVRRLNTSHNKVNKLTELEKKRLAKKFEKNIYELEKLLQIDLSNWKNKYT